MVYAILSARCCNIETDEEKVFNVVMKFDSETQLYNEADNFFDNVYGSFNKGLPKGWHVDEEPEIVRLVDNNQNDYVVFDPTDS